MASIEKPFTEVYRNGDWILAIHFETNNDAELARIGYFDNQVIVNNIKNEMDLLDEKITRLKEELNGTTLSDLKLQIYESIRIAVLKKKLLDKVFSKSAM